MHGFLQAITIYVHNIDIVEEQSRITGLKRRRLSCSIPCDIARQPLFSDGRRRLIYTVIGYWFLIHSSRTRSTLSHIYILTYFTLIRDKRWWMRVIALNSLCQFVSLVFIFSMSSSKLSLNNTSTVAEADQCWNYLGVHEFYYVCSVLIIY